MEHMTSTDYTAASGRTITQDHIEGFKKYLCREERADATIEKYLHDLKAFLCWLEGRAVTREEVTAWKQYLYEMGRKAVTINASLAALHNFFDYVGWTDCRVKYLKIQRRVFRDASQEMNKAEYVRLVQEAYRQGNDRLALVIETICSTGIRVSELKYITVAAVEKNRADIQLKGKCRTILITGKLAKKLKHYIKKQKIASGEVFLTEGRKSMSRRQIWYEMKKLSNGAQVEPKKIYPHNLRHLFARTFYKSCRDIVRLADVLGHSSIDTTRIYLITTGAEYEKELECLGLVS